jgi:hypothetical protein
MPVKYFYIDDDPLAQIQEIAKGLSINHAYLDITAYQPKKWEEILNFLLKNQEQFDGLLLDWGLTRQNEQGENPNFTVEALAQQIRRLSIEGLELKKDFPIVLCSAQYNFNKIYDKELSSHDLFDLVFEKDSFNDELEKVVRELAELAKGYKELRSLIDYTNIPVTIKKIFKADITSVDYRVVDYLEKLIKEKKPIHEISRFLLSKVICANGQLINEDILAARLGMNLLEQGKQQWEQLLIELKTTAYEGIFSSGWRKWWMSRLETWWERNFNSLISDSNASEKVAMLSSKFNVKLISAKRAQYSNSDLFWTVCSQTKVPIALEDGVLKAAPIDKSPWEDDEFFSMAVALEKDLSEIHPLERERVEKLKSVLTIQIKNDKK